MSEAIKPVNETELWGTGNFVTARELAQFLRLSKSNIYKLAFEGELPGFKIGDSWRFDMEEITQWVKGRCHPSSPPLPENKSGIRRKKGGDA